MHDKCDVFFGQNNVERLGFAKNKTFGEIVDLAILHKCPIIIKNGKGKWYLKGVGKDEHEIHDAVIKNKGQYPNQKCWVLEFPFDKDDLSNDDLSLNDEEEEEIYDKMCGVE
jgi:hypothetical protein